MNRLNLHTDSGLKSHLRSAFALIPRPLLPHGEGEKRPLKLFSLMEKEGKDR
jgi:hypothetical protein